MVYELSIYSYACTHTRPHIHSYETMYSMKKKKKKRKKKEKKKEKKTIGVLFMNSEPNDKT